MDEALEQMRRTRTFALSLAGAAFLVSVTAWIISRANAPWRFDDPGSLQSLHAVRATANGMRIVTSDANGLKVWDAKTRQECFRLDEYNDRIFAVSPNTPTIAILDSEAGKQFVVFWDSHSGSKKRRLSLPKRATTNWEGCSALSFGSRSDMLFVGTAFSAGDYETWPHAGAIMLFERKSDTHYEPHWIDLPSAPWVIRPFADDRRAAVCGWDGMVAIVNIDDARITHDFTLPEDPKSYSGSVYAIDVSPDGRLLAADGGKNTLRVLDTESGKEIYTFSIPPPKELRPFCTMFSPDGMLLATGWSGTPSQWTVHDTHTWKLRTEFKAQHFGTWWHDPTEQALLCYKDKYDGRGYLSSFRIE